MSPENQYLTPRPPHTDTMQVDSPLNDDSSGPNRPPSAVAYAPHDQTPYSAVSIKSCDIDHLWSHGRRLTRDMARSHRSPPSTIPP